MVYAHLEMPVYPDFEDIMFGYLNILEYIVSKIKTSKVPLLIGSALIPH